MTVGSMRIKHLPAVACRPDNALRTLAHTTESQEDYQQIAPNKCQVWQLFHNSLKLYSRQAFITT